VAEPRLIRDYLAALGALLPAEIVEELADGVAETYQHHLALGLAPQTAAHAALDEFGQPEAVAAAFTRQACARRAARTLLGVGPVVGGFWAVALIGARAWDWTIPAALPVAFAAGLVVVITLLMTAAFCGGYRAARRAAGAALVGLVLMDLALPGALVVPGLLRGWPLLAAACLSLGRAAFAAGAWRRIHVS
jgi:hypothetical protein